MSPVLSWDMRTQCRIFFLLLWHVLIPSEQGVNAAQELQVRLQMREETPPFTRIGSIASSIPSDLGHKLHFLTDSSFFSVTPSTGEVRVARLVDRERLCPEYKLCCGVVNCELEARIFVTNKATGDFAATVNLKVDIQDQNDNRPTFPSPTQTVRVSEASQPGTYVSLIPAADADIEPVNQIQRYTLIEPTGTFILDLTALPSVRLQLTRPLDRETTALYTATLEACDPGACARQTVDIQVLDENDNYPKFATNRITKMLMENIDVGHVVLQLNATDADSEERGRVLYAFHGTVDPDLLETFELVQETGEIRLKRPLAANIRSNYRFKVVACDAVRPACNGDENSTAEIVLNVKDVNNFAPSIHTVAAGVALSSPDKISGTTATGGLDTDSGVGAETRDGLTIMENTPPSQVAVLTVRDDDLGENARVTCMLNDSGSSSMSLRSQDQNNFVLKPGAPGIYSLRTARQFDFEVEPTVSTKIVCHDFGQPQQLTSARVIVVRVLDVNEFQPEFSRRVYIGRVPENAPAGMEVLTTTATDRDRGARLHYYFAPPPSQSALTSGPVASHSWSRHNETTGLDNPGEADNMGPNKYFVIEPETGIIRTSHIPLDRELLSSITLVVLVADSNLPPVFTATTTVSIEVLDENDNAPIFVNPPADSVTGSGNDRGSKLSKAFTVVENAPRFTRLSEQLEARDPDQGDNGRVHFSLLDTYAFGRSSRVPAQLPHNSNWDPSSIDYVNLSKHVVDQPLFRITPDGGIETLVELDREAVPTYLLKIGVHDRGAQPLASTTLLRVNVLDVNDNAPVWGFPTLTDRTINLTTAMKPGSLAGRLRADDADAGDAGRVDFLFLGPRGEPLKAVSMEEGLLNSLTMLTKPRSSLSATPAGPATTTTSPSARSQSLRGRLEENGYRVGPLYLNGSTGEIWIAEPLTAGTINLHLRAQDRGKPRTQTDAWLTINVFIDPNEDPSFFSLGGDGTLNITIILVMITITAIVSLFLIIGIVCVRRRPTRYMGNRSSNLPDGAASPGHTTLNYSMDHNKESLASAMASTGWASPMSMYAGNQFMAPPGSMTGTMLDDGHLFGAMPGGPGVMGYGALVAASSDTASLIYVPQPPPPPSAMSSLGGSGVGGPGSMTPIPVEMSAAEYQSRAQPMHTFGTLSRKRGSLSGGFYTASTACGAVAYEPHLDADSGDSGRGPSEEGNQLLMSDQYRNGHVISGGHPYNTYGGYRPSSRQGFRPNLAMDMTGSGNMLKLHAFNCPGASPGGTCGCYILSDPQGVPVASDVSWTQGNGIELTDPYGTNYSPNYPISRPLPIPNGPPLPPPRSPVVSGSHTGTLRRPNTTRSQSVDPHEPLSPSDTNGAYGQPNGPIGNGYTLDSHANVELDSGHGTGPPVRIDLRQAGPDRNGTNDVDHLGSKPRVRLAQMGLPPLATKQGISGAVSTNNTDGMERDPISPDN